ncbi:alpha-glucosidase [Thorsellia kenyensis]|uniref:Alpha-glucosidase n=1 Tax=Thorsellia kenyensis TaxID=1549888 RepID=A0ABV6CD06_9GAMM
MLQLTQQNNAFSVSYNGTALIEHQTSTPVFFTGVGHETMDMYRGNFNIKDYVESRIGLSAFHITTNESKLIAIDFYLNEQEKAINNPILTIKFTVESDKKIEMSLQSHDEAYNRLWVRTPTDKMAPVWGGGEQMSYFNLKGRNFPFWTSEPGVGRDKSTYITWRSDVENKAGGDYYNTNYPQPTFISLTKARDKVYAIHANTTAYADFDFQHDDFHELQFWAIPSSLVWFIDETITGIVESISLFFGRQPKLPDWIIGGAVLGLKKGRAHAEERLEDALQKGVQVSALWCEDWSGIRETSFGVRLFWDWQANEKRYPNLKEWISELNQKNIQFLAYTNPYLCIDGPMYKEGKALGYMATQLDGSDYNVDFGEFYCGVVDFTIPEAKQWFSERIIQKEMLDIGINGWMADFGEYLPIDLKLSDNSDPKHRHNEWPVLWAEVNAHALAAKDKTGDAVFFMRAGYSGVQKHCPLLWGGDQSVDFSRHDGLVTVIPAALSSGLLGNAYHHSDIGGYTSLFGNVRTPELFMRWAEMSLFTPVMRTHECNRPADNFQFWQDDTAYAHFARMTQLHVALVPYVKTLIEEAYHKGLPLQRPLVMHYQTDENTFDIFDQYLYGEDLLIAPVYAAEQNERTVYLPKGQSWIHIWSDTSYEGGQTVSVKAPIGHPPVFIKSNRINNPTLGDFLQKTKA